MGFRATVAYAIFLCETKATGGGVSCSADELQLHFVVKGYALIPEGEVAFDTFLK